MRLRRWMTTGVTALTMAGVAGCGAGSDAHHMVIPSPDPEPAVAAMRRALADARVDPAESPPAPEKMLPLHQGETLSKLFDSPFTLLLPLDLALQRLNETRNRNDDRDPLSPDCVHEL